MSKVALVTGGNRGIGKAIIEEFAKSGLDVVINYCHHEDEALELQKYISEKYNVSVMVCKCDISKEEEVEEMINDICDAFGGIDILVNNASICKDNLFLEKRVKDFKRILENKSGKIISISSTNAIDTFYPESCDYDASKAGIISLTHNMAREFAPYINVNCVCPGWTKTDMNKDLTLEQIEEYNKKILIGRFAEAKEIANVVVFLASNKASYVNDSIIRVDGGKFNE